MSEAEIRTVLAGLFSEVLDDRAIDLQPELSERDIPGFDSNKKVLLILAVEERFGIRLRSREIDGLRRVGDWIDLVHRHSTASG